MKQPIPISVINQANNSGQFNTLRVWIILKQLHKNTVLYNFTYQKLANKTGISHTSLRKHIPVMIKNGWAKISGKHLHLTGINKLKKHENETCIPIPVMKTKPEQILQLRKVIIHQNIKNQERQIKHKRDTVNNCKQAHAKISKGQRKLIRKAGSVKNLENSLQEVTTLSNRSIGKLFFSGQKLLSQITGHRIQKKLREAGLIQTQTRLVLVKANANRFDLTYLRANCIGGFIYNRTNGNLYRRLSNGIVMQ